MTRRAIRQRCGLVAAGLAVLSAAACSASEQESEAEQEAELGESAPTSGVVCPEDASAVEVPGEMAGVPLPDGAVVYDVEDRAGTGVILTAVSPESLQDVLDALNSAYSSNGYTITSGETEELDAEANWTGAGQSGRWAIRDLAGSCDAGTQVQVFVAS